MSAKWSGNRWDVSSVFALALVWVLALSGLTMAGTLDFLDKLATPFQDPWLTVPEVIKTGSCLPGDCTPVVCPAQKDFATPLALGEAVDLALCNNAQIKSAWASIKVQAAVAGEARAAYWPTLSGTVSRINDQTRVHGSSTDSNTVDSTTVNGAMSWRIFDFGGRAANRTAANQELAAALANQNAIMQKILVEVIQAYFDAQTARAVWQAKEQNEEIAKNTLDTTKRREAKGADAHGDTLQATTALARAALDKNRASGYYRKALSMLIYAIGVPTHTPVTLAEDLYEEGSGQANKDLDAWLHEAEAHHPAIVAARAQKKASQSRVTVTRSDGLPFIDFSANYYENGRPGQGLPQVRTQESTVGVMLTIPIFDGFSRTYKIRGAEAQVEQKSAALLDTEHQILMEVVKAHADADAALQNLQASEKLLAAAQESLGVSQRKYEKGAADILEILNTQTALSEAGQERIRCLDEWRSARLRLLANAGLMGRSAVNP